MTYTVRYLKNLETNMGTYYTRSVMNFWSVSLEIVTDLKTFSDISIWQFLEYIHIERIETFKLKNTHI